MDVGGTTTDIGALVNGFPRESSIAVNIGGVRTNFRMPDILSIGLGGGTRIHLDNDGSLRDIGPDSVGYRLPKEAYLFGGSTLTASDIAVKAGYASFGNPSNIPTLRPAVMEQVLARFREHARGRHRSHEDGGWRRARRTGRWRQRSGAGRTEGRIARSSGRNMPLSRTPSVQPSLRWARRWIALSRTTIKIVPRPCETSSERRHSVRSRRERTRAPYGSWMSKRHFFLIFPAIRCRYAPKWSVIWR